MVVRTYSRIWDFVLLKFRLSKWPLVFEKESSLRNQTQFDTLGRTYPVSFCRSKKSLVACKKSPVSNYERELSRALKRSGVGIMPLSERLRAKCFQIKSNECSSVTGLLPASCLFYSEGTGWCPCRLAWTSFLQWTVWHPCLVLRLVLKRIWFF